MVVHPNVQVKDASLWKNARIQQKFFRAKGGILSPSSILDQSL